MLIFYVFVFGPTVIFTVLLFMAARAVSHRVNPILFGTASGILLGLLLGWRLLSVYETSLSNPIPLLLGQLISQFTIDTISESSSPYVRDTIPGLLRTPTVYVPVSVVWWSLVGAACGRMAGDRGYRVAL